MRVQQYIIFEDIKYDYYSKTFTFETFVILKNHPLSCMKYNCYYLLTRISFKIVVIKTQSEGNISNRYVILKFKYICYSHFFPNL